MRPLLALPAFAALVALQSVIGHFMAGIPGPRPLLVITGVVCCGLLGGPRSGAIWGAVGGLGLDLASAGPLGPSILPAVVVGALSGLSRLAALRMHRLLPVAMALAGGVVYGLLHMLLLHLSGWGFNLIVAIYEVVLPSAVISLLVLPPVYGLFYWLQKRGRTRSELGW